MKKTTLMMGAFLLFVLPWMAGAQEPGLSEQEPGAEEIIKALYDQVTFDAGTTPDWTAVKDLFLPQATIILRTTREATTVFTLDGFVQDFVSFIERSNVQETGFSEKILKMHSTVFGDMAFSMVLYEASIPGRDMPPQKGVDYFLLSKRDQGWKIVAITNDIPALGFPLPEELW
jgi:hypothetical protein